MTPNISNNRTSYYESMYAPEDKDQAIVMTPYGKGTVIRTRYPKKKNREKTEETNENDDVIMREIELTDWIRSIQQGNDGDDDENDKDSVPSPPTKSASKKREATTPQKPSTLYTPQEFPSVQPQIGDDVATMYGRGIVTNIRDNDGMLEVRVSSWRLANRDVVKCYLHPRTTKIQVVRPKKVYEMNVWEKVEHAQTLKSQANQFFSSKKYKRALELYAQAVDAVRYVQHKKDSPNTLRADLLVVMITCCNNAATCCIQLQDWDRAIKFGTNGLVLIEALEERAFLNKEGEGPSKIHRTLNQDGISDSQLFGTWQIKSLLVMARGHAEKHDTHDALTQLKKGLEKVSEYKIDGDSMHQQLASQEKQIRKLHGSCIARLKVERKKEKQRAKAMFGSGSGEEKKDEAFSSPINKQQQQQQASSSTTTGVSTSRSKSISSSTSTSSPDAVDDRTNGSNATNRQRQQQLKKQVSFADGSKPGDATTKDGPSFWEEHMEAMIVVGGIALGSALVHFALKGMQSKRR